MTAAFRVAGMPALSTAEFAAIRELLYRHAGISLSEHKRPMVSSRLDRRLQHCGCATYSDYLQLIRSVEGAAELQVAIDRLTTNETHFFREPKHFDFLRERALAHRASRPYRVWSAACSSGEEPYTLAMVLAEALGDGAWEVLASDISTRVLESARAGHYPMERARHIPVPLLQRWCLKGTGPETDTFLVKPALRAHVNFRQVNLTHTLPDVGEFDAIFLRNVLIYFDAATKDAVATRLVQKLRPEGVLVIGHAETLTGICPAVVARAPTIYGRATMQRAKAVA